MSDESTGVDVGRFARLLTLIAGVTAVSLFTSANVLPSDAVSVAVVAIGAVALVTAMTGFLIAVGSTYDESMRETEVRTDREPSDR